MPRASLRSVLLICAFNAALMCRVSTQITGRPASASALNSHCDSGPASNPVRLSAPPTAFGLARNLHLATILPASSTIQFAGLLDQYVQSSKMLHAALLLMLEAR